MKKTLAPPLQLGHWSKQFISTKNKCKSFNSGFKHKLKRLFIPGAKQGYDLSVFHLKLLIINSMFRMDICCYLERELKALGQTSQEKYIGWVDYS